MESDQIDFPFSKSDLENDTFSMNYDTHFHFSAFVIWNPS